MLLHETVELLFSAIAAPFNPALKLVCRKSAADTLLHVRHCNWQALIQCLTGRSFAVLSMKGI